REPKATTHRRRSVRPLEPHRRFSRLRRIRCAWNSSGGWGEDGFGLGHFRAKMIDVEQQNIVRILAAKLLEYALLPAFGEIFGGVDVFVEEAVLVGDAEEIEHGLDHVEVRDQNGLRQLTGELLVAFVQSRPEARRGLADVLRVELAQMEADLHALVELVRLHFPDGDGAQKTPEGLLTQAKK